MIHPKLKLLSHSGCCLLHTCPRKYQLTKLWPEYVKDESVHTAFGKMFGEGIQQLLVGKSLQDAVLAASTLWSVEMEDAHPQSNKSFWTCIAALEKFSLIYATTDLADYEVFIYEGKPATELSFCIDCGDGFYYRGYIDVLLRHKLTGALLVVDVKHTGAKYSDPVKYQNSNQAIGYSVVIDKIAPGYSQYEVMYYEYLTLLSRFEGHTFIKTHLQRANWLRDIIITIQQMQLYDSFSEEWPMYGESCSSFNRACSFIDICDMSHANLNEIPYIPETKEYTINVTLDELITAQLEKT